MKPKHLKLHNFGAFQGYYTDEILETYGLKILNEFVQFALNRAKRRKPYDYPFRIVGNRQAVFEWVWERFVRK